MAKLNFLLEDIKNRELVLPEFQREYTWKKEQVKKLFDSIIKDYPTGSLLEWKTNNPPALKNMTDCDKRVSVLLDGQQRLTALYLIIRDAIPPYYRNIPSSKDPRNLYFDLKTREFKYYSKIEMENNPEWIKVLDCFKKRINLKNIAEKLSNREEDKFELHNELKDNLDQLEDITEYDYPVMKVKENACLEDSLTVFDRVNTGGTPLSQAEVALAHMCSNWEKIRRKLKEKIDELKKEEFTFDLKFMIRGLNAVLNGRAYYHLMHDIPKEELQKGWNKLKKILEYVINFLRDRAYIYSDKDLSTPNILIPLIGYLSENDLQFKNETNLKKMLFWMYAGLYKRRYSSSVDQYLEKDLGILENNNPIKGLIETLKEEEGNLKIGYEDLQYRGVGHPLYNMMCFVIRSNKGVDWANNLNLANPIGSSFQIERHHIFPKSVLKQYGYDTGDNREHYNLVHEIANRTPLTKSGNMEIFAQKPKDYLPVVEQNNPGNLDKFFIPKDENLWKVENYKEFLKRRRTLLVEGINEFLDNLLEFRTGEFRTGPR